MRSYEYCGILYSESKNLRVKVGYLALPKIWTHRLDYYCPGINEGSTS